MRIVLTTAHRKAVKRIAKGYRCSPEALVVVAVEELIAAHATPAARTPRRPRARHAGKAVRTYTEKPCAKCGQAFQPSGPRSTYCGACQDRRDVGEVVWNGTLGRNGVPLPDGRAQAVKA